MRLFRPDPIPAHSRSACVGVLLWVLGWGLLGASATAWAIPASTPLDLATAPDRVSLIESMLALKQAPGSVSPAAEVLNQPGWLAATEPNRNSSWVPNAVWMTGVLHNSGPKPLTRWIVLTPWRVRDVQFHTLRPDDLHPLDHQRSGSGWPMASRALHHVDPVFPVTLAPGESVRILLRAQDSSVPTTFVTAWTPDAYTQALTWTLVHETITLTVCGVLIALLLWTREPAGRLLAGLMAAAECLSATFHGQWVPYFLPGVVGHLVPVFTIAVALCYLMFTLSARSLLDIGRRGFWAWVLGGINAVSLLTALGTLFVDEAMLLRKWVNALGELVFLVWPLAAWRTPLPDRPGARAIQMAFVLSGAMMGLAVWVSRYGRPVHFAELIVVCVLLVYSHVHLSSQKARRKQTEYLAFHDPLTGLPNRVRGEHLLHQALDAARSRGGTAGLLCMDLDKFKLVNDTHGHATGDLLLQGVANRLRHSLGAQDSACRLSGDEFIAILPEVHGILALEQRCEAIRAQFTRPFDLDGKRLFISFSIGASLYPAHADTADALMRHADTALYEAKRAGENGFRVFHPDMNTRMLARVSTRNALHLALEREEFELHYQPQVGLRSGAVVGVEALLRWRRPGHGLSQPQDFIAVAEESGLIVPVGAWVLQEACRQAAQWHRRGWATLKLAVNVSPLQFQSGRLVQDVVAALSDNALPPDCLELELTESVLIGHEDAALHTIEQLKALGVRLSIDDFGTGYSGLSYLHRFRVDRIKIDRSFIARLGQHAEQQAIVRAIVQMATHLGLHTMAEGVENAETVARLADIGCDEAQGFHYARPLPAAMVEPWRIAFESVPAPV